MKLSKVIRRARELASPYCITDGKGFRLKDIDPDDTGGLKSEDKPRAKEALAIGVEALRHSAGHALCPGSLGRAPHLSGDGRGRQGRSHQTCDVRRKPSRLPGRVVQGALSGGP